MLPGGIPVNSNNVAVFLRALLESADILLSRFEEVLLEINSNVVSILLKKEYINIIIYSPNHLNILVSDPFWKVLYDRRNTQTWNEEFLLLELNLCVPYSNATLERFFSQIHLVKTDWWNGLNEENLTHLRWVKVDGPKIEELHANLRSKAVTLWYNDWSRRMHQPQQKAYKNREMKQT